MDDDLRQEMLRALPPPHPPPNGLLGRPSGAGNGSNPRLRPRHDLTTPQGRGGWAETMLKLVYPLSQLEIRACMRAVHMYIHLYPP